MACETQILRQIPLFALLDDEETAVLAAQVEVKHFLPRQRIYKIGDTGGRAYVMVSGAVRVTTIDDDQQDVVVDEPGVGEFFGFASMLDGTPHQTNAIAVEETMCIEVDHGDIETLVQRKPHAAMDMLSVIGRQFHARSSSYGYEPRAIPTTSSRRKPRSGSGSPTWLPDSADHSPGQRERVKMPHERDETARDSERPAAGAPNRREIGQAHEDVERGLADTDRRGVPDDIPDSADNRSR